MFGFVLLVIAANLIILAFLYVLRHVIAIRAPVLFMAVGISIFFCVLYPFLAAWLTYPRVVYFYAAFILAGAGALYIIESKFFTDGEMQAGEMTGVMVGEILAAIEGMPALDVNRGAFHGLAVAGDPGVKVYPPVGYPDVYKQQIPDDHGIGQDAGATQEIITVEPQWQGEMKETSAECGEPASEELQAFGQEEDRLIGLDLADSAELGELEAEEEPEELFAPAEEEVSPAFTAEEAEETSAAEEELPACAAQEEAYGYGKIPGISSWSVPEVITDSFVPGKYAFAEESEPGEPGMSTEPDDVPGAAGDSVEPPREVVDAEKPASGQSVELEGVAAPAEQRIRDLVANAFDALGEGDRFKAAEIFFRALKLDPPPRLASMICIEISSIYLAEGHRNQSLAVMETLRDIWGPMLNEGDMVKIKTIIIQLRREV